jgi:hypothetical protein
VDNTSTARTILHTRRGPEPCAAAQDRKATRGSICGRSRCRDNTSHTVELTRRSVMCAGMCATHVNGETDRSGQNRNLKSMAASPRGTSEQVGKERVADWCKCPPPFSDRTPQSGSIRKLFHAIIFIHRGFVSDICHSPDFRSRSSVWGSC